MLSPIEIINEFNAIKNKYRRLYFDIYTVLLMFDWRPLDDYIGQDNFDFLVTSELYDRYMYGEECDYAEVVESSYESFEVEIYNCRNIKPPEDYLCSITDFSYINIEELITKYNKERDNYLIEINKFFTSNSWTAICIEDVELAENYDEDYIFDLDLYISPYIKSLIDDYEDFINKDNVFSLLNNESNLIVDSSLWWGYKIS